MTGAVEFHEICDYYTKTTKDAVEAQEVAGNSFTQKFAQSNLGRGPRCGAVAHIRRKAGYIAAPQIGPQKYPFPWTDPQTPLPASSPDPSDL